MCHIVLLLPLLGLVLFWFLDVSLALPLSLGLVVLSGIVALLLVRLLRKPAISGMEGMRGATAEVIEALRPRGTVRYHATFWSARAREPIAAGETVRIVGHEGLCLRVEKVTDAPSAP